MAKMPLSLFRALYLLWRWDKNQLFFLTSDGAVWGYKGSVKGIVVQGFPPLSELVEQYLRGGGRLVLCSVCQRTCSTGSPDDLVTIEKFPEVEIGGFATILELAMDGFTVTF